MHQFWLWVYYNSPTLQAAASLVAAVGTPLLIVTLRYGYRAAQAAENAAEVNLKQLAQSVNAHDKSTTPLIHVDWLPDGVIDVMEAQGESRRFRIMNVGLGPAFAIAMFHTSKPSITLSLEADALGVGQQTASKCNHQTLFLYGLTVAYESGQGRRHECVIRMNPNTHRYEESHRSFPSQADELFDISFYKSKKKP